MALPDNLEALKHKAGNLPNSPGVYLYKDSNNKVIYVGKAKSLRDRVRNYFLEQSRSDAKTGTLVSEAADVDYILVDNEKEALALESDGGSHAIIAMPTKADVDAGPVGNHDPNIRSVSLD